MRTHSASPLWSFSAAEPDHARPLGGADSTDLAIVGGGFTGLSTALHAAQAGLDCLVLEAETLGHGGSGRNVGLVNAGLWLPPSTVTHKLGATRGDALVDYLGKAPAYVFDLIEKHQIRCEPRRSGTIHAAHAAAGMKDLESRARDWAAIGAPVTLLDAPETRRKTGSAAFHGGLLDARAGTINPTGYLRGLARAAQAAGARIATGTPVIALQRDGTHWRLSTPEGSIRARNVVLGTNAYTDQLWPGLAACFTPISFFQLATHPLGAEAAHILPEGQGLWDTAPVMFSMRRDVDGRLIIGSMGAVHGSTSGLSARWANRQLKRLFPELPAVGFEAAWDGRIAFTPDHLPRICQLAKGLYTPIGYNGRGITTGTMFGKALAGLLTGDAPEDLPLPLTTPRPDPARHLKAPAFRAGFLMNQLLKSF